jgi:hypothetical protein
LDVEETEMNIENVLAKRQALANKVAEDEKTLGESKAALAAFNAKLEAAFEKLVIADEPVKKLRGRAAWSEASKKKAAQKAKARQAAKAQAAKAAKAPKAAKAAKAPKAAKAAKKVQTVTPKSKKNAAAGRQAVARGERPTLKEAMKTVMGKKAMNAEQVVEGLKERKWLPTSQNPRQYISFMFSSNTPEVFERTEPRGFYRVRGAGKEDKPEGNGGKTPAKKGPKPKGNKAAAKAPDTDQKLNAMFGIDTTKTEPKAAANPFADSSSS